MLRIILLQTILDCCEPVAIIAFLVSGITSLLLDLRTKGMIHLCLAVTNFFIFYGFKFLKK